MTKWHSSVLVCEQLYEGDEGCVAIVKARGSNNPPFDFHFADLAVRNAWFCKPMIRAHHLTLTVFGGKMTLTMQRSSLAHRNQYCLLPPTSQCMLYVQGLQSCTY